MSVTTWALIASPPSDWQRSPRFFLEFPEVVNAGDGLQAATSNDRGIATAVIRSASKFNGCRLSNGRVASKVSRYEIRCHSLSVQFGLTEAWSDSFGPSMRATGSSFPTRTD